MSGEVAVWSPHCFTNQSQLAILLLDRNDQIDLLQTIPQKRKTMSSVLAISDLDKILKEISPHLYPERYAFATLPKGKAKQLDIDPVMSFVEEEGVTWILLEEDAKNHDLPHTFVCQKITLHVNSALEAVGFMAAISNKLKEVGVPCNVVAGYYHDHLFIPVDKVADAMQALEALAD